MNVKNTQKNWHNLPIDAVLTELKTTPDGLDENEAQKGW